MKFIIEGRGINEKELPQIIQHQEILKTKIGMETNLSSNYIEDAKKIIGSVVNNPEIVVDIAVEYRRPGHPGDMDAVRRVHGDSTDRHPRRLHRILCQADEFSRRVAGLCHNRGSAQDNSQY